MKLLMMYCNNFEYSTAIKNLDIIDNVTEYKSFSNIQLAFIQIEEADEEIGREKSVEKKLLNFTKWICRKNNTTDIVLHSFAHLSESKAKPEFTKELLDSVQERLEKVGYNVSQTPFGYFLDLKIDAPGYSLARVFKSFE